MKKQNLMSSIIIAMGIFIASSSYAGWEFGQGVIDNLRGKDSGAAEYVDQKVQGTIDDVREPFEKADKKYLPPGMNGERIK